MFVPDLFKEDFVDSFFKAPWFDNFFFNVEGGRRPGPAPEDKGCGPDDKGCGPDHKGAHRPPQRYGHKAAPRAFGMPTDIREEEDSYELSVDLPGFKKDEVNAEVKNGYLTISASHEDNNDEKDEQGNYIRRERRYGTCRRSFYVGDKVDTDAISARFEDGVLKLSVPKEAEAVEEKKVIAIEG